MKNDIYFETLSALGGGRISSEDMSKYCQYKSRTKDRYCNATCQNSCAKCRFFEPTSHAKVDILSRASLDAVIRFNKQLSDSYEINKTLHETIARYNEEMNKQMAQIENIRQDARVGKAIKRHRDKQKKEKPASGN